MDGKSHNAKLCEEMAEGKDNPFWTMEAISEHIGMLWSWYRKEGYELPILEHGRKIPLGKTGDFDYELIVIERYLSKVLNLMAALEPELYSASEGDEIDSAGSMLLLRERLKSLSEMHQKSWEES